MPSDSNLTIELDFSRLSYGEKLRPVSWSYVELTMQAMSHFGITPGIEVRGRDGEWTSRDWLTEHTKGVQPPGGIRFIVPIAGYKPAEVDVEADWSSASYFLAAGAIGPRPVRVRGLNLTSLQGDRLILSILRLMGARVEVSGHDVTVYPSKLRGVDLNMDFCPDIVPTVLALGAHAEGTTVLRDINHLQYKESDRVVAMAQELRKAGCVLLALPGDKNGGLAISSPGNSPHKPENGLPFRTHNDHRIAMALCLLGLPGTKRNAASEKSCANTGSASVGSDSPGFTVELDNPACVSKSFPGFWKLWRKICA